MTTTTDRPPHLSGCYTSRDLALVIAGRLNDKGLPWSLQECDHIPRACMVIDREDGHPSSGPVTPPVWLLWTDYNADLK